MESCRFLIVKTVCLEFSRLERSGGDRCLLNAELYRPGVRFVLRVTHMFLDRCTQAAPAAGCGGTGRGGGRGGRWISSQQTSQAAPTLRTPRQGPVRWGRHQYHAAACFCSHRRLHSPPLLFMQVVIQTGPSVDVSPTVGISPCVSELDFFSFFPSFQNNSWKFLC